MLSLPRFTRSLLDPFEDDFAVFPMDYVMPRGVDYHRTPKFATPTIKDDKYNFSIDMRHFEPSDVSIKFEGDQLRVSGKREKRSDDGKHYEYREYVQQFSVPENVMHEQLKCELDEKGRLKIEAPIKAGTAQDNTKTRHIPIEFVNKK